MGSWYSPGALGRIRSFFGVGAGNWQLIEVVHRTFHSAHPVFLDHRLREPSSVSVQSSHACSLRRFLGEGPFSPRRRRGGQTFGGDDHDAGHSAQLRPASGPAGFRIRCDRR